MFDIGFSELVLFGVIALIVLGPEKLPHAIRTAGRYYAKFRRTVSTLQAEIENELNLAEARRQMQEEITKIRENEADIQKQMDELKSNLIHLQQSQFTNLNNIPTKPLFNQWFLLGEYDKKRRLPKPPFLPNYQADNLLNQTH